MACKEVLARIDELEEKYLNILEDVCNIESPTEFKKGVDAVGEYFVRMARDRGWKVEVFPQEKAGDVVCITMNSDSALAPISVSGHIDTVHPIGLFGSVPVRCDENNMYGPGVMDCKGGVVAAFYAMDALDKCGFKERPVMLLLQTDEETSSRTSGKATINYICEKAKDSVAFLNLEGYKSGTAVLTRKGIVRYKFSVHGKALHSSRCYDGASAVLEAAHKIIEIEKLKDANGITCSCGLINGGTAANTVPAECSFVVDIRFATPSEEEEVRNTVKQIADKTSVVGCTCDIEEISYRPAMHYSEKNNALLERMNEIYKENGLPTLEGRFCVSGSDAAYVTASGIPCIDCIGTEGSNIHSCDEYIIKKSLAESAKRIAAVIHGI